MARPSVSRVKFCMVNAIGIVPFARSMTDSNENTTLDMVLIGKD